MQKKQLFILLGILFTVVLVGCNSTTNNATTVSSDATIVSLTFQKNDSFPSLSSTVFTIEDRLAADTGYIYNIDSIAFGTRIDSVIPSFLFKTTPASAIIFTAHDTIIYAPGDTVNFADKPCYIEVMATDLKTTKCYNIDVRVHTLDPDLFVWSELTNTIYPAQGTEHKAFMQGGQFVLLVNDGFKNSCYKSKDGKSWAMANSMSGLPDNASPRRMVQWDEVICYGQGDQLYHTENGANWTATDFVAEGVKFENLLFAFNGQLWAIVEHENAMKFATILHDGNYTLNIMDVLPKDFPVAEYAAVTFASVTNRPRAMVVGGYAADGTCLNTRWNLEYTPSGAYNWTNFSIEQPNFQSLTGVAIAWYNNRFYMFGGVDADNQIGEYTMLESVDEGLNWSVPDSVHNVLPATFTGRQKTAVLLGDDNAVYLFGGQSRTEYYSDAYRGKLNSIDWK